VTLTPHATARPLLPPVHKVRTVRLAAPLSAPADAVMDAIAHELKRQGNRVRACSAAAVEFDGPGLFHLFGGGGKAAAAVSRGTVTFDTVAPRSRIRVDLQYDPWVTYALPCLAAAVIAALQMPLAQRCFLIGLVAVVARENYGDAADLFERWVRKGVSAAEPYP